MSKISSFGLLAVVSLSFQTGWAQVFPLTENSWSNPDFVKRFMGSYGVDTDRTPSISTDESAVFQAIAPLIESNPREAIRQLQVATTPTSSGAMNFTLGNLFLQESQVDQARREYREAIRKFPNFLRAYKNLGIAAVQANDFTEARTMLLKTIELGGVGDDVYGLLGYIYMNQSNPSAALIAYEQALFFKPSSRDWRLGRVQALSELGRSEDVIGTIDQLIQEFPTMTSLYMMQANAFVQAGRTADAAATLEVLRARNDAGANALLLLGNIYLNFGQIDLAAEVYGEVASSAGVSADRLLRIAQQLAAAGAWTEVDKYVAIVESKGPTLSNAESLSLLNIKAQSDLSQGRSAEAAAKLDEVVSRDPLNGRALVLLANYFWKGGEIERAEIYFERAAKVDSVAADALVDHARLLVSLREFRKAVPLLERAQLINPRSHIAAFLDRVASASRTQGG